MLYKIIYDRSVIVIIVIISTLTVIVGLFIVGLSASLAAFNTNNSVYGLTPEKKDYTDCMGYRAYTEYKGISRFEANYNTSAVDERIEAIQLGQEPIATGPVAEQELLCLQEIRAAENNELREIVDKAGGFEDLIESNNQQLELLEKLASQQRE